MFSRREFLGYSSLALTTLASRRTAAATPVQTGPLGRPIGLQLYTVRQDATRNLVATLKQIAAIGYREVEMAGFYGKPAKELRALLADLGLSAPSSHYSMGDLRKDLQAKIDDAAELGVEYFVCSFPAIPGAQPSGAGKTLANSITLDDWKWNAEQLNEIGELTRKAGLRTGYHNHNMEFRSYDGVIAYDRLLQWTDPDLVTMQMDVAWVVTAGFDPVSYLRQYPERIGLLHVKDVRTGAKTVTDELLPQTTEVGRGTIDWSALFAAADPRHLEHYFVEQENFERPALQSVRMSYEYLRGLS